MSEQIIFGAISNTVVAAAGNKYGCPFGQQTSSSTIPLERVVPWPTEGIVRDLKINLVTAPGAGNTVTYAISNSTSTSSSDALTVTISGTDTTGDSGDDIATFAAEDTVRFIFKSTSGPAASAIHFSYKWIPDTAEEYIMGSNGFQATTQTGSDDFISLAGFHSTFSGVENDKELLIPTPGTIKKLIVRTQESLGSGTSIDFTVRKNTVDTALTVTATGDDVGFPLVERDTVNSFTVTFGDRISLESHPNNTPDATQVSAAVVFVPDTNGIYIVPGSSDSNLVTKGTRYGAICSGDISWNATETNRDLLGQRGTSRIRFTNMRVRLTGSPGFGSSYTFTLRLNGADTSLTGTISSFSTTLATFGSVQIPDNSLWATETTATSSPNAVQAMISYSVETIPATVHIKGGDILGGDIL